MLLMAKNRLTIRRFLSRCLLRNDNSLNNKPKIGVSQCLLGDAVRYDGKAKPNHIVIQQLSQIFQLIAICPEVEAGLSTPRPPVQLSGNINSPRLTGRDDPSIDITEMMRSFCSNKMQTLHNLHGYILKSRSPSCGLNSTPVFIDGKCVTETSRGVFARQLCKDYPNLPVIEDTELDNPKTYQHFLEAVRIFSKQHTT